MVFSYSRADAWWLEFNHLTYMSIRPTGVSSSRELWSPQIHISMSLTVGTVRVVWNHGPEVGAQQVELLRHSATPSQSGSSVYRCEWSSAPARGAMHAVSRRVGARARERPRAPNSRMRSHSHYAWTLPCARLGARAAKTWLSIMCIMNNHR